MENEISTWVLSLVLSTLFAATPLLLAALGGLLSERSGVIQLGLEGLMLLGAFVGACVAHSTHSPWIGALAGAGIGALFAAFYGFFVLVCKSDQVVASMALNLLATGIVPFFNKAWYGVSGSTPALEINERFTSAPLWMAITLLVFFAIWFKYLRSGLWVQVAGEHPKALETSGISALKTRWVAVVLSGVLAGLGGVALSTFLSSSFSRDMTAGRGFMALAALILGKWKPIPTAFACLLFGFTDVLQGRLQGVAIFGDWVMPVQFIQILPYGVTLAILAGFVGESRAPRALGRSLES
jgi:ABC-type uncharacterized transport system permease subunit